jgi:proteasome accessory factor A
MRRDVPWDRLVSDVVPFLVTRQIFAGAGKMGVEGEDAGGQLGLFQIAQRSDFFSVLCSIDTMNRRPIVNTRDEPHADAQKYRRLHVIVGDANLAEVATFLKVGVTALVLCMIEDDVFGDKDFSLVAPVQAIRKVSYDLSLSLPLELAAGGTMTALEIQWELFDLARKYAEDRGLEAIGGAGGGEEVLRRWEEVLSGLETDPMSLASQLDWVAKLRLLSGYRERHGLDWSDARLAAMDLQYHDLRPDKSLFRRLPMERLVSDEEVEWAVGEPPPTTRAYFRGKCLQRWAPSVAAANWDSLVFDLGSEPLRRIPMMEPLRGTAAIVDTLLDGCSSPAELIARLDS